MHLLGFYLSDNMIHLWKGILHTSRAIVFRWTVCGFGIWGTWFLSLFSEKREIQTLKMPLTHTHKLETWNRFYSFIYLGDSVWLLLLFSHSVVSDSLRPHELQHTRLPCPSPSPGVCSNSCPLSQWCHPIISSSVTSFSSCPQSFPASGSFPMSLLFASGGQCTGGSASTSVLPMNIQGWFPLGLTGLILLSKGLSRVFSSTTIWKHWQSDCFMVQLTSITTIGKTIALTLWTFVGKVCSLICCLGLS